MDTLNININTGGKRIQITRDGKEAGEIFFNPTDVLFAERFYALFGDLKTKLIEFNRRDIELKAEAQKDEDGMPINMGEQISIQVEANKYMRDKVDNLFGSGVSQIAFGDVYNLEVVMQLFDGILPFFETVRAEKIAAYTSPASAKRNKRKR